MKASGPAIVLALIAICIELHRIASFMKEAIR